MNEEQLSSDLKSNNQDLELFTLINQIIEFCDKIPQTYRNSCFEILLKAKLQESNKELFQKKLSYKIDSPPKVNTTFKIPIDVSAFLSQYNLDESVIRKIFVIDGQEIRAKFQILTIVKSKAQMQVALLLALENTLKNHPSKFEFSAEDVRKRCHEHAVYDSPNFKTHFRNNSKLFKSLTNFEKISLSSDGKSELAEIISQMVNEQK